MKRIILAISLTAVLFLAVYAASKSAAAIPPDKLAARLEQAKQ